MRGHVCRGCPRWGKHDQREGVQYCELPGVMEGAADELQSKGLVLWTWSTGGSGRAIKKLVVHNRGEFESSEHA